MISILPNFTSIPARGSGPAARHGARSVVPLATILCALAACTENGIVEPARSASPFAAGTAAVIVTPTYSAFDRRSEFTAAGTIAHLGDFEAGFTGSPTYPLASPWASNGVTYTSGVNVILGPAITFGVRSNAISTTFGAPLIGEFAAADAFTMLGIDLTEIIQKVPVTLAVSTNLATYSFPDLDIPLAETGSRFLGLTLSQPGEYLTGFRLTYSGPGTALLLDNVAVGHVGGANAEPDVDAGGVYVGLEGSAIALAMSGTDADGDALTYSWDLGDGTTGSGATPPTNHIYAENGSYDIMLAADDGRGGADTSRTTATVANVAPVVSPFSLPSVPIALVGGRVTLPVSAGFSDPGATDTHLMTLDCGTGVSIQENTPNGTAGGTCTFSSAGVYAVQLTVRDDDGDSDTEVATGQVVVYDPSGGWVTGGGWIDSPAGAYTPALSVSGKLTFGFVARYQSSSTTPNGSAEFKLNLAKLAFRSTTLDWLVVADGATHLQGRGTLNGGGDYAFDLRASDGASSDEIRIRIWLRSTGELVYDNQPGSPADSESMTPLGGGSIQIHTR